MKKRILIIDDDLNLAEVLAEILQFEGYNTIVAASVMEGLRIIRTGVPDIIICDWQMPNLNGNEFLRELRLSDRTVHTPFVVITGHSSIEFDFAPTAILQKPVTIPELRNTIQQVFSSATN